MKNLILHYVTLTAGMCISLSGSAQENPEKIWVTFNDTQDVPEVQLDGKLKSANPEVQQLIEEFTIYGVEQALPDSRNAELQKVYELECLCNSVDLSAKIVNETKSLSQPEEAPKYELLSTPDDYNTVFATDYALDLINAQGAWDYTTGNDGVILGISDGNFYVNHEELQTEYVSYSPYSTPTYYYQHGTAVAVTAGGSTNNSMGKSSIGYNCKLSLAPMSYNSILQLSYGGAKVINVSWSSGCAYSNYVQTVINEITANGSIMVAAAGNGGTCGGPTNLVYPAAHDNVIAVSSIGPNDNHERTIGNPNTTHQHNSSVDICAPGYDVALTIGPGAYMTGNGTSFASPLVTGTVGLMFSVNPCLTIDDVLNIFAATAVNIDAQNPAYIGTLGYGRLDAAAAVQMAAEWTCQGQGNNNGNNGNGGSNNGGSNNGGSNNGSGSSGGGNNGGGNNTGGTNNGNPNDVFGDGNNGNGNDPGSTDPSNPGNGNNGGNSNGGGNTIGIDQTIREDKVTPGPIKPTHEEIHGMHSAGINSDDSAIDFAVSVAPNPAAGSTVLRWTRGTVMHLTVYNSTGALLKQQELNMNETEVHLNLEEAGVYTVVLNQNGQQVWRERIVNIK